MFQISQEETRVLKRLGRELALSRIALRQRQSDFATQLGISIPTYRRMERGSGSVPLAYWLRVLAVLDHLKGFETALGLNSSASSEDADTAPPPHRVRKPVRLEKSEAAVGPSSRAA